MRILAGGERSEEVEELEWERSRTNEWAGRRVRRDGGTVGEWEADGKWERGRLGQCIGRLSEMGRRFGGDNRNRRDWR